MDPTVRRGAGLFGTGLFDVLGGGSDGSDPGDSKRQVDREDVNRNSNLLKAAEDAGFEVLVTTDKNISYQQNLTNLKIAIVVLGAGRWSLVKPHVAQVVHTVNEATTGSFAEVEIPLPANKLFTRT